MKIYYKSFFKRNYVFKFTVLVILFLYLFSCKKERQAEASNPEKVNVFAVVNDELKTDFDKKKFTTADLQLRVDTLKTAYKLSWRIRWDQKLPVIRQDSTDYTYVPIKPYYKYKEKSEEKQAAIVNYKRYLLIANNGSNKRYYLAYTFMDSTNYAIGSNYFSGQTFFKALGTGADKSSLYKNGIPVSEIKANKNSAVAAGDPCTSIYFCSYGFTCFDGNDGSVEIFGTYGINGCLPPDTHQIYQKFGCLSNSQPILNASTILSRSCPSGVPDPYPLPPAPGGPGGGGSGGGGSGPNTAPGGIASPAAPADMSKIYTFGGPGASADDGRISCASFVFKQVGNGNSQEAGVSGLGWSINTPGGVLVRSFYFRTMYVNVGINLANGTVRTAGEAAEAAAHSANKAAALLSAKYGGLTTEFAINSLISSQIENEFRDLWIAALGVELNGGYGGILYNPSNSSILVTPAKWNGSMVQILNWSMQIGCK